MRNTLLVSSIFAALANPAASETAIIGQRDGKDIVTVRVDEAMRSRQALDTCAANEKARLPLRRAPGNQ